MWKLHIVEAVIKTIQMLGNIVKLSIMGIVLTKYRNTLEFQINSHLVIIHVITILWRKVEAFLEGID